MNIFDKLKGHSIVEANNLHGLRSGHMLAQEAFDPTGYTAKENELDNGVILALGTNGKLKAAGADETQYFLHYSEEHIKFLDSASLDMFTVYFDEKNVAYPRAIALYEGDTFTTNNCAPAGVLDTLEYGKVYAVTVAGGILTIGAEATAATVGPLATLSSLPAGQTAVQIMWKGGL